jgi:hypothetical protein
VCSAYSVLNELLQVLEVCGGCVRQALIMMRTDQLLQPAMAATKLGR